ncbi:disease resistance protein Pik-2 [Lolium perenne]|uniref:disease resistance protein Pik-2 n=1 Tax=Lolium perenne TaxID=4522 RepID=UPI0021F52F83|nr:disease resistance protein Pik-2-like [Lolium perenne]
MESTVLSLGKSVLSGALGYAASAVAQEVALQLGIQGDHSFITDELEMMQAFLMASHEDQEGNKVVKTWVKQVREVAYDVEDCLQDFAVRLENLSWWHIPFRLLDRRRVAEEMKELRLKVEDVSQRNLRYRLIEGSSSKPTVTAERSTISTEVLLHIAEATRRAALQQNKKVDLVKLITEDADDLGVIAVWAPSSDVGVTSIIRAAYDAKNVKVKFQCRAWVRLMHPFHPSDFFISLVRQFYMHSCEETGKATEGTTTGMEVTKKMAAQDNLVDEFNRYVTQKSYLVIINNVSTIEEWDWIKTYFPSKRGSRIIVSTQKFEVASLCTKQPHMVSEIDQKWSFDKDFYVFYYTKVDTLIKEDDKAKPISTEPAGEEHVNNPTHATTVAAASEEDELIDRKAAKNTVIRLIDQRGYVITICGMGGIGKTTLVRDLYQQELGEMFQRHAWLTMSRSFEHHEFLRELFRKLRREDTKKAGKLQSASSEKEHKSKEKKKQILFEKLAKILLEQKCLIVLDDLSSTVELQWVLDLLPVNTPNRIVVTTRELDIAKYCSLEEQIYNLELLDCKESNLLFAKKVFKDIREKENFDHNPDMIEQANLVLKKCGGLPLAISIVGSFLATKPKTAMEWSNLNTHISAELESNPELGMIKTVLTSSYDGLPYHLKSCFLYWSIFPEGHDIRWTRLVRRWIAEQYARGTRNKTAEEIGNNYITELINRNMVRPPKRTAHVHSSGRLGFLQIHDLIREIGITKSTEENLVFTIENGCNLDTQGKIRHLAISSSWTRNKTAFEHGLDFSHLRSLTVFGGWESFFISEQMKLLRVLDLEDTMGLTDNHLHQICQLFHLNYLSLRRCEGILRLPNSLGNLKHLQTLDVEDTSIINLPRSIIKLRKLQYLRVGFVPEDDDEKQESTDGFHHIHRWLNYLSFHLYPRTGCLFLCYRSLYYLLASLLWLFIITGNLLYLIGKFSRVYVKEDFSGLSASFMGLEPHGVKFPRGIRKLKALHTMGVVNINGGNAILEDLQFLTELRKLRVTGLNKKNCMKFFSAIANHKCLESLSMRSEGKPGFFGCLGDPSSLHMNLQSLELYGNLVEMPKWIDGLKNLVKLVLRSSRISEHDVAMQILGKLPNLAILRLLWHSFEGEEVCFSFHTGAFPSLMVLELGVQDNLQSVKFKAGANPKLELLVFSCRPEDANIGLFSGLPSLTSLKEFMLDSDNYTIEFMENLRNQLARNLNGPVLKRYNYSS